MSGQQTLFPETDKNERVTKYQSHSLTSISAAIRIEASAATLRASVLRFLISRGSHGATDEEIQDALIMGASTQRPRRVELVERGLVLDSGKTKKTRSGRSAVIWSTVESHDEYFGVSDD